jgi:hypothetical protein
MSPLPIRDRTWASGTQAIRAASVASVGLPTCTASLARCGLHVDEVLQRARPPAGLLFELARRGVCGLLPLFDPAHGDLPAPGV